MTAFVSVITDAGHDEKLLKYTGRSLAVQMDAPSFEWIVAGDMSAELTEEFIGLAPTITDTVNHALDQAVGEYVWFLKAGACLSDAYVLRDVKKSLIMNTLPDLLFGLVREDGRVQQNPDFAGFSRRMIAPLTSFLFRRRLIGDVRFNADYVHEAAYDFTLRFIDIASKIASTERLLTDINRENISRETAAAALQERSVIRAELLHQPSWKNKWIQTTQTWSDTFMFAYPKTYRFLRNCFSPVPRQRSAPVIKSAYRGIFFKRR